MKDYVFTIKTKDVAQRDKIMSVLEEYNIKYTWK